MNAFQTRFYLPNKKKNNEDPSNVREICDSVKNLFVKDDTMSSKFREEAVKKDLIHLLKRNPDSVYLDNVWSLLEKNTGRKVKPSDLGVQKLGQVFYQWPEFEVIAKDPNDKKGRQNRIRLKRDTGAGGDSKRNVENYVEEYPLPSTSGAQPGKKARSFDVGTWKNIEPVVIVDDDDDSDDSDDGASGTNNRGHSSHLTMQNRGDGNRNNNSAGVNSRPVSAKAETGRQLTPAELQTEVNHAIIRILYNNDDPMILSRPQLHKFLLKDYPGFKYSQMDLLISKLNASDWIEFSGRKFRLTDNIIKQLEDGVEIGKLSTSQRSRNAMELMKYAQGLPEKGTEKQKVKKDIPEQKSGKTGNQNNNNSKSNKVPSADFLSFDGADANQGRKSEQVIDLTSDSQSISKPPVSSLFGPSMGGIPGIRPTQAQVHTAGSGENPAARGIPSLLGFSQNLLGGPTPLISYQSGQVAQPGTSALTGAQGAASSTLLVPGPAASQTRLEPAAPQIPVYAGTHRGSMHGPVDVHCKPIERVEFEHRDLVVHPVYIQPGMHPTREFVNNVARECIETLAESNEYVNPNRIQQLLCRRMNLHNIRQLGLNVIDQLQCVHEHNMTISKINAYIMAFVKTRSICTLHDLRESIREYVPNKGEFTDLKLGPLQRLPEVYRYFNFPPDQAEIPEITSMDVLDHFHNFLTKEKLWQTDLAKQLEPFMNYLVEQYSAPDAFILGVIIRSVRLATTVLKKAQRDTGASHREFYDHFKNHLKNSIEDAFRKFRATILKSGSETETEIRPHYLKMRPELVIMEVFEKLSLLITVTQVEERKAKAGKLTKAIKDFLLAMRNDDIAKPLLHLAICMSNTTLEETAMAVLMPPQDHSPEGDESVGDGGSGKAQTKPPPRKEALVESLKKYVDRCLYAHGALRLVDLDRVEAKLSEDFEFTSFHAMGHGRFLSFITTEAAQLLEEGGGMVVGSSTTGTKGDSGLRVQPTELVKFVKQCKKSGRTEPSEIEDAMCSQYNVSEVRHLGCGSIPRLITLSEKHDRRDGGEFFVHYESALLPKKSPMMRPPAAKVGILGSQTREAARHCLHNCPLLEDLAEWSQWSRVFEPELGRLRDFVENYGGVITKNLEGGKMAILDFHALEVSPGKLLKIVSTTSPDHIQTAIENRDVASFCGHLVSMVVAYKGVDKLPMALLVGHVRTALLQLHAGEAQNFAPGAPTSPGIQHGAALFVLRCLIQIPLKICAALADELFLIPLGQVVGAALSKQILVQLCTTNAELNRLIELGCVLGIHEWRDFIQQKCALPESAIQRVSAEEEELLGNANQEAEEEEEDSSSEEEEEDLEDILTGDDGMTVVDEVGSSSQEDKQSTSLDSEDDDKQEDKDDKQKGKNDIQEGHNDNDDKLELTDDAEKDEVKDVEGVDNAEKDNSTTMVEAGVEENVVSTCEGIVNMIRKEEFGVGVHLSEDGQKLMKVQQERLGRSLDRLSKDLYSKDTHFVLELVQNADDNTYHPDLLAATTTTSGDCPSVKFTIEGDKILVQNNELGFEEKNVRALCDVGRSTKGKHKFGYIGQKGIGFKSVFRVTDAPEVHSNGFHIKFDVNSGPMGYILPHWVTEEERPENPQQWMTSILLRLRPDMQHQYRTLAARFNDIHPSLLLFLHRLRQITIENKVENSVMSMRRRDVGDNIIEIDHSHACERWLVTRKTLDASRISIQAKSGADVESTEIALAFPLRPKGQGASSQQTMPPKQPVFAFLPLRSYGFRFIIQGDFDVPSSREDVDRDSSWNQWLRNEIHTLFLDSLETFKGHSDFNSMEAVCAFLQFVPMEDEVLDFFKPVASDILKKLKAKPCVPTQPNSQGVVSWKIPSQTVRVRDPLVRSVITPELLQEHLGMSYLHGDVAAILNPTLTSCLGIESLTSEHLFQLGKAAILKMNNTCGSASDVVQVSRWLACMYRSLDEFQHDDSILGKLESLAALPLSTGQLVAVAEKTLFFPVSSSQAKKQKGKDLLLSLQQDLHCVHPLLLDTGDKEVDSQVQKLLARLGVKQLTPFDVINHHILPVLKSDTWKSKSVETLVAYLVYIREQTDLEPGVCNLEELREVAPVLTNRGIKLPSQEPVHFPTQYGNKINLTKAFSGYEWTLLDSRYIPQLCSQATIASCHSFFSKLGVEDCLSVRKKEVCLKFEELASSPWRGLCDIWTQNEKEYFIEDLHSEELEGLILHNSHPETYEDQMRNLCIYLDRNWDARFSKCIDTQVRDKNKKHLKDTETTFCILLKGSSWLPAVDSKSVPSNEGGVLPEKRIVMKQPNCLYVRSNTLETLLSQKVLYLDVNIAMGPFLQFLGLKNSISTDTVKDLLLGWSERKEPDTPAVFCTSLEHIKNVYSFLNKKFSYQEFQNLLRDEPVYFVPTHRVQDESAEVVGKMLRRKEIWINDNTGLFVKYGKLLADYHSEIAVKRIIGGHYYNSPEILDLFRQVGRVEAHPSMEEHIELLNLLCTTSSPKDVKVFTDVLFILSTLGQVVCFEPASLPEKLTNDNKLASMKKKIQRLKVFPTKKHMWVSLDDRPMIADNKEWEKWFAAKEGVHFLDLEERQSRQAAGLLEGRFQQQQGQRGRRSQHGRGRESQQQVEMVEAFMDYCGVKRLSECVKTEPTPGVIQPCLQLQKFFHDMAPSLQRFLIAQYPDVHGDLEDRKTREMLADAKFYQTGQLEVAYRILGLKQETFEVREEKCAIVPPVFYFHRDHLSSVPDIIHEVARYFSAGDPKCNSALRSFLHELSNILQGGSYDTLDNLLRRHDADAVDVAPEKAWHVEPPKIPEPEPQPEPEPEPESQNFLPFGQTKGRASNPDEPFELRVWPPQRSENRLTEPREKVDKPASNIWPPPQAKDYMQSVRDLPSNIRVQSETQQDQSQSQSADSKGDHSEGTSSSSREFRSQTSVDSTRSDGNRSEGSRGGAPRSDGLGVKRELSDSGEGQGARTGAVSGQAGSSRVAGQPRTDEVVLRGEAAGMDSDSGRKRKLSETEEEDQRTKRHSAGDQLTAVTEETHENTEGHQEGHQPGQEPRHREGTPGRHREGHAPSPHKHREHNIKGTPVWSDMVTEYTYDELATCGDLSMPGDLELSEGAGDAEVGHWGEALVAEYLQLQEKEGNIVKFKWINENAETGCPYDFEVQYADETGIHEDYIEVKSTVTSSKQVFEISVQQVKFAAEKPGNFHIYRVFNAGDPEAVRLIRIHDLDTRLSQKQVKLCMVI